MKKAFKIFNLALVVIACAFVVGSTQMEYWVFKYRQNAVRQEIKKKIKSGVEESELKTFSLKEIQTANVEWKKPRKEFRMNGVMFDVVRIEHTEDGFIYKCINDDQESELFAELDKMVDNSMNGDKDENNLLKSFVKDIKYSSACYDLVWFHESVSYTFPNPTSCTLNVAHALLIPPPEV